MQPDPSIQLRMPLAFFQKELALPAVNPSVLSRDVWPEFALALLTDPSLGSGPHTDPAYTAVVDLYREWVSGTKPESSRWIKANTRINAVRVAHINTPAFCIADNASYAAVDPIYAPETARFAAMHHYAVCHQLPSNTLDDKRDDSMVTCQRQSRHAAHPECGGGPMSRTRKNKI